MNLYASAGSFDNQQALSEDRLRKIVPSIFAVDAHPSRSERFAPIPTIEIVHALAKVGFSVVAAKQAVAKRAGFADYTKHLLRFRHVDALAKYSVGDTIFEVCLKNANDGTSIYDLFAGLLRIACLNGMVVSTGTIETVKVRHTGDAMGKVIEGTYRVLDQAQKALAAPADWSKLQLDNDERLAFAESARVVRFGDAEGNVTSPIEAKALLVPRRVGDNARDLWTTFNVVQENAVRGGLTGFGRDASNRLRQHTTREIKGIDGDVKLNRALWVLAENMAKLKLAA